MCFPQTVLAIWGSGGAGPQKTPKVGFGLQFLQICGQVSLAVWAAAAAAAAVAATNDRQRTPKASPS